MQGEANDLLAVVFWALPRHQDCRAGQGDSGHPLGSAGQPLPHDDRELGCGTGQAQPVFCHTLIVAGILQPNLIDHQAAAALDFHTPIGLESLPILQPVEGRGWLPFCFADKPGSAGAGTRDGFGGLGDAGQSWKKSRERNL